MTSECEKDDNSSALPQSYIPSILKAAVKDLSPAYFAMVMATGIVSISAHLLGMSWIALVMFRLNIGTYLILWLFSILRLIWFPRRFFGDMMEHKHASGFFTMVASSCILGSQFLLIS